MERYPKISMEAARINAKLTQKEAAKALEITTRTLQNYEQGKIVPSWTMVKRMECLYKFPADYIFFGSDYAKSVN